MSEPGWKDWIIIIISAIATGIMSGITGAMAWFSKSRADLHARMTVLHDRMEQWDSMHAEHETQLAVLHSVQANTMQRLEELKKATNDVNEKLDQVLFLLPR